MLQKRGETIRGGRVFFVVVVVENFLVNMHTDLFACVCVGMETERSFFFFLLENGQRRNEEECFIGISKPKMKRKGGPWEIFSTFFFSPSMYARSLHVHQSRARKKKKIFSPLPSLP